MTRSYALVGLAIVAGGTVLLWPWLTSPSRKGILVAGATAYSVQLAAFWALARFRGTVRRFMWAWAGGMVARAGALAALATVVIRGGELPPLATLLGFVGFLFALLVTEFFFLIPDRFAGR